MFEFGVLSYRKKKDIEIIKNHIKESKSIGQAIRILYYDTNLTPYFHPCDYEELEKRIKKHHRKFWKNLILNYVDKYKKNLTLFDFISTKKE